MMSYLSAAAGGVLIGLSSVVLMASLGRIAGISGIVGGLVPPARAPDRSWRIAFIAGLVAGPLLLVPFRGALPIGVPVVPVSALVVAGLLVGAGTTLGGGCTSGHGICGLARLSPRSMAAVSTFMAVAAATVFLVRHVL